MSSTKHSFDIAADPPRGTAHFTCLRAGFLIAAFGERGCFPKCRGMYYLGWLLAHPLELKSAIELMTMEVPRPRRANAPDEKHEELATEAFSFQDAMDPQCRAQAVGRLNALESVVLPRLRQLVDNANHLCDVDRDVLQARQELHQLKAEADLLRHQLSEDLTPFGVVRNLNGQARRKSAQATTRANLLRCFVQLKQSGLRQTASHLEQSMRYRYGCWVYTADAPRWIVEWDL